MEFKRGQKYRVNSPSKEKDYVFVYESKYGKHHMFRELNGGWLRTYTDNQLIGKKIEEA